MKFEPKKYESPEVEEFFLTSVLPLVASPLENPEVGEEWDWD